MRFLFIDDNDDLRALMKVLLEREGYEVKTADAAATALHIAPDWQPHIIISDIGMPGPDGYDLMRQLRADARLAPFRSIALSGFAHILEGDRGYLAGFDECMTKPVHIPALFAMIRSLATTLSPESLTSDNDTLQNISDSDLDRPRRTSC